MIAERLLTELESQGATLAVRGDRLRIQAPRGTVSPELLAELRAHKSELIDLLTWPEECLAAEREHGHPCARLHPFVGGEVRTLLGQGRLIEVLPERAVVILDRRPHHFTVLLPAEVGPPGATAKTETMRSLVH